MKIRSSKAYINDLAAANKRYRVMLEKFEAFRAGAHHLENPEYPLKGIVVTNEDESNFMVGFLGTTVRFTFQYDHAASRGVIAVTGLAKNGEPSGPTWSFRFNDQGEVAEIEPRANEGVYNIATPTDATDIVLAALNIALTGEIEGLG